MIIQTVKFKSALSEAEIQQVMEERAPQFRALPGLLQKYYLRDIQTGEVGAVYILGFGGILTRVLAVGPCANNRQRLSGGGAARD